MNARPGYHYWERSYMRIACVGGGPSGLYFATLVKLRDKVHEVTVIERNPPGITYGWGVVFWDDLLDSLYNNDPESARVIHENSDCWNGQEVHVQGEETVYLGGYGFSISRERLLTILAK